MLSVDLNFFRLPCEHRKLEQKYDKGCNKNQKSNYILHFFIL